MFDDRITIVYNTSFNPAEEIYKRSPNNPDGDQNNGGTTIYRQELELSEKDIKKLPFDNSFKRQLFGGASVT